MGSDQQINGYLVCNARYHDNNFARLELLKRLAENENINTKVADSFRDVEAIANSKLLLIHTCDLRPTLRRTGGAVFLKIGGKWFALHATNALLDFIDGKAELPQI